MRKQYDVVVHHRRLTTHNKVARVSQELDRFPSTVTSEGRESLEDAVLLRIPALGNTARRDL